MTTHSTHARIDERKAFSAIDIGSTKVVALTGYRNEQGEIVVLGSGVVNSKNLDIDKEREELNVENIRTAVYEAIEKAHNEAGFFCQKAVVGTAGRFVRSSLNRVEFKRLTAYTAITHEELNQQFEQKIKDLAADDEEILHVKKLNYMVDEEFFDEAPVREIGASVSLNVCVVKMKSCYLQQLRSLMKQCNLQVAEFMFEPLASATSVLSEEERKAGCTLVDIGGGTTDIAMYEKGALQFAEVIPFGGNCVTNDIRQIHIINALDGGAITYSAEDWRIAEQLKIQCGKCLTDEADKQQTIGISATKQREALKINLFELTQTIQNRMEEIVASVQGLVNYSHCSQALKQGIVLTGGGAELKNTAYFFEQKLLCAVRVAAPNIVVHSKTFNSNSPRYATVVGLLMRAAELHAKTYIPQVETAKIEEKPFVKEETQVQNIPAEQKLPAAEIPKQPVQKQSKTENSIVEKKKREGLFAKMGKAVNGIATNVFAEVNEDSETK